MHEMVALPGINPENFGSHEYWEIIFESGIVIFTFAFKLDLI